MKPLASNTRTEDGIRLLVNLLLPLGSGRKGVKDQLQHSGLPVHQRSRSSLGSAFARSWTAGGLPSSEAMGASSELWKQLDSKSGDNSHQHINKARLCNRLCFSCALLKAAAETQLLHLQGIDPEGSQMLQKADVPESGFGN